MSDETSSEAPSWLNKLEKLREKQRLQRRLGHEAGAGAPCLNCNEKCSGLDLHFWRKICKVCKCSKDSHNVEDDDMCGWVQFELLGTKPAKAKHLVIPALGMTDQHLEWTPPGATTAVERYLHDMPTDQIPISGSEAAKKRQQRLQTQIPAHDFNAELCDSLTPAEQTKMCEYVAHIRKHCVGQGELIELPVYLAERHEFNESHAKLVPDYTESQIANSEAVILKKAELANLISNLNPKLDLVELKRELLQAGFNPHSQIVYSTLVELKQADLANQLSKLNLDTTNSNIATLGEKCHGCQELFDGGAIAISISRTTAQWHPHCFQCFTCKQPLEDLLYFFDKKSLNIYCGRDYAKIKGIPRCGACDELIFTQESCLAEDRVFHVKHFCCWECDIPLAGLQYVMEGQNPMCLLCFEKVKAANCQHCGLIIKPDQQGVALEKLHWHSPDCFKCRKCSKALFGGRMLLRNSQIYCSPTCVALDTIY